MYKYEPQREYAANGSAPMKGQSPAPMLLTAKEAARSLSVCEKTLWSLTHPRGPIPAVRIGRAVRYSPEDLRGWIESQKGGQPNEC
jgi:excisionase family DNA binding protein